MHYILNDKNQLHKCCLYLLNYQRFIDLLYYIFKLEQDLVKFL